ncbi:MAG: hypothetical protein ACI9OD_000556 [Limisphaerales bacterium]|jgi:hypothetical protein
MKTHLPFNRRQFLIGSTLLCAGTAGNAASKPNPLRNEVGLVVATLAAHQSHRKPGGMQLTDIPQWVKEELGIRVLDMNTMNFPKLDLKEAESLRAAAERHGCVLTNLKLNQRGLDPGHADKEKREHAVAEYLRSIDLAAVMGMRWVRPLPTAQAPVHSHLINSFRQLAEHAQKKNITVLVENFGWMQNDPNSVVDLIREADCGLAASPDTGNWSHNEVRYPGLKNTFPLAATCDFKAQTLGPEGEHRSYDLKRCFEIGWQSGYRGAWCIEHGNADLKKLRTELLLVKGMLKKWIRNAR